MASSVCGSVAIDRRPADLPVDRHPHGDRPQPAAERGRHLQLLDLLHRLDEHFLAQLLRFAVVAQPAQRDRVDHRLEPRGQLAEGFAVAGLRGLDQVLE